MENEIYGMFGIFHTFLDLEQCQKLDTIQTLLEEISYYSSSIYETGANSLLVELHDRIYDLQLELQATVAALPVLQQETQAQDVVAVEQSGAGALCAIPTLPGNINDFQNEKVPRLLQLMWTLRRPIEPEQLNEVFLILKSIPPLIADFLKKRRVMIKQQRQHLRQQQHNQQRQQQQQQQSGMGVIDGQLPGQPGFRVDPENPEVGEFLIENCIRDLVHACQCKDSTCRLSSCQGMKRMVMHIKNCKRRTNGNCPICKQLFAHCCHHARLCQVKDNTCLVPFCSDIKQRIKEQLIKNLRSPNTPEKQNRILNIFKRNPYLMAEVIKDRKNFDFFLSWLVGFDLEEGSSPADGNQVKPQDGQSSSLIQIQCARHTVHECNGANHGLANCQKMNRLVAHVKNSKKKMKGRYCLTCKKLRIFYGHHALLCQEQDNMCSMPFCSNVKRRLKEMPECQKSLQLRLLRQCRMNSWLSY